jgi:hypothetical protein
VEPIGIERIGWKMYIINGAWDVVTAGLIVREPALLFEQMLTLLVVFLGGD